jgi:glycosyltransferase involved in cell wall biosynthesis
MAMAAWAQRRGKPAVLMSESQHLDHPRVWWKEAIKRRRVMRFNAGLVGGERHRDYLERLGMPRACIALGYNAVDHDWYEQRAEAARAQGKPEGWLDRPYFLAVNRFVPEKHLVELVQAHAAYRARVGTARAWDLVLAGDGPERARAAAAAHHAGTEHAVHFPGFLQAESLVVWYAHAGAFVHPSRMEPWGLVVNEAAACGLPLIVSTRAGCVETLVPEPEGTTGYRIAPEDPESLRRALGAMTALSEDERRAMGARARNQAREWGPRRFALGMWEAIERARRGRRTRVIMEVME